MKGRTVTLLIQSYAAVLIDTATVQHCHDWRYCILSETFSLVPIPFKLTWKILENLNTFFLNPTWYFYMFEWSGQLVWICINTWLTNNCVIPRRRTLWLRRSMTMYLPLHYYLLYWPPTLLSSSKIQTLTLRVFRTT